MLLLISSLALTALFFIYLFLIWTHDYWKKQRVQAIPDPYPGFGHMLPTLMLKENLTTFSIKVYEQMRDASAIGFYFLRRPGLVVRDPELVKCVLQTNFTSFHNNGFHVDESADPIMAKNPFFTTDLTRWKIARTRTTSHLSGKKLRHLFTIIHEVCAKMDDYLSKKIIENNGSYECELKDNFVKYTGEIVANAAFGIEGQCFSDNPDRLSFARMVKLIFTPTLANSIKQALLFYVPSIGNLLGISLMAKNVDDYFRENVKAVIKERKRAKIAPNDYLQFCIDANGENQVDSIIADILIFYGDVYETSSTTLASVIYFLSQNKTVQVTARDHVVSVLSESNGIMTYDSLKKMNYLDQVISESLRHLPPLGAQFKECTKKIKLTGIEGTEYRLEPGNVIFIPVAALQMDSRYWPKPELFDPDRFNPENTALRNKFVYLPFGEGPRMCIGIRLGMMIVKMATAALLVKFTFDKSSKMKLPLEYDPGSVMMYVKGGLWGRFEKLKGNE